MLLNTNLVLVREFGFMDPWQFVTYALSVYATISMYVIDFVVVCYVRVHS